MCPQGDCVNTCRCVGGGGRSKGHIDGVCKMLVFFNVSYNYNNVFLCKMDFAFLEIIFFREVAFYGKLGNKDPPGRSEEKPRGLQSSCVRGPH